MKMIIITVAAALFAGVAAFANTDEVKQEVQPFDRGIGISTSTFIPKGTVGAGVAFSYNNYNIGQGVSDAGYSALFSLASERPPVIYCSIINAPIGTP